MGKGTVRWLLGVGVALAIGVLLWWRSQPDPVPVTVATADRGVVETTVSNTRAGTITACRRAKLSPSVGGQIARLPVNEGDHVKRGGLLLELWNDDLAAELELARRESQAAQATARAVCVNADEAGRDATRQQTLFNRGLVSEEIRDRAKTLARSRTAECQASNESARVRDARIGVIEASLARTRLIAPFDGVVAEVTGELNEYVTPSPPGIPTPPAVDLIDTGCFYVDAPIDEVDAAGVTVGQLARITLDAFGKRAFPGKVRRIGAYVIDLEKQARTVSVEVEFSGDDKGPRLLAGYSADVDIILSSRTQVLRVPSQALLEGGRVFVYDAAQNQVKARNVSTGVANWQFTEVTDGLAEGDQVVTNPDAEGLADGSPASRVSESELP